MERRKLTKEDIDKVRDIEGFPIGKDEDIIALSDAPYYTACPNPFIKEFIEENGTPYDEETDDYHREPFADDVEENKHDLIYNIHGYHTKVPPKAIQRYILHYTNPGDIIFDGFSGSGMTGVAVQKCSEIEIGTNRSVILSDLSPFAAFISANYNNPNGDNDIRDIQNVIKDIKNEYGDLYKTNHILEDSIQIGLNGKPTQGDINYVVWSNMYLCPQCSTEINYYKEMIANHQDSKQKMIECPCCHAKTDRTKLDIKYVTTFDERLNANVRVQEKVPVLINYSVGKKRFTKVPDESDIEKINTIKNMDFKPYPIDKFIHGDETERLFRVGVEYVKQIYPTRALFFLSEFFDKFKNDNKKIFLLTSTLQKLTILNRYMPEHGSRALVGPRAGTYYLPNMYVENNVIKQIEFQLKKLSNLSYKRGNALVTNQSTTNLSNIPSNSIDYCFVDPPFGKNIMYSELNYVAECWLKIKTNNNTEAIINKSQKKELVEYQSLMTESLKEIYRILKPKRWITIEFHNSKNAVWMALQQAIGVAGFLIADVSTLNKEKKTINQYTTAGSVDQDLIISAYKPQDKFIYEFEQKAGSKDAIWLFVHQLLDNLLVAPDANHNGKIDLMPERQNYLLYDRMVAWHIMHGVAVPMDAQEFYAGLDEHFIKRDDMYFLPEQVTEYDQKRAVMGIETTELAFLAITDEKNAIQWLNYQLQTPQSYAELQPLYLQELHQDKNEAIPELLDLLKENFLLNEDTGKWYIPDITKAGDIAKLREKSLMKEFEGYLSGKGKLKVFRSEAIRLGVSKLWKEKNYKGIVDICKRLPEKTIQEDQSILMYYDNSLMRI